MHKIALSLFGKAGRISSIVGNMVQNSTDFFLSKDEEAAVFIDFTAPAALEKHLEIALLQKTPIVIGTTGLSEEDFSKMQKAAKSIPVFYAPNFSFGMFLMKSLVKKLGALSGDAGSYSLSEAHRVGKKDTPGGTALALQKELKQKVEIHSIREGETVGVHTLCLTLPNETIEITHKAQSRALFAEGALKAARFLITQKPGYYGMDDLIGDKE